jgi:hypothetical protein
MSESVSDRPPRGVLVCAAFFVASGALEIVTALMEAARPLGFWPVWDALGRGSLHFLLAWGLWRRIALCRSVAMIYCLAALITYVVVLGLALAGEPLLYPPSVRLQSLLQIPSCLLLLPYLRSPAAAKLFLRPLFG